MRVTSHEQRAQLLAERVRGGQLGERSDHRRDVGVDPPAEAVLHGTQPLLDQPVHGRRQAWHVKTGQRCPGPHGQRLVLLPSQEQPLEADHVDHVWVEGQAVCRPRPHDRIRAEALAQPDDVALQGLVSRPRRILAPHHVNQSGHRNGLAHRQGQSRQHRLALRRPHVHRLATVARNRHAAEEMDLHPSSALWPIVAEPGALRSLPGVHRNPTGTPPGVDIFALAPPPDALPPIKEHRDDHIEEKQKRDLRS